VGGEEPLALWKTTITLSPDCIAWDFARLKALAIALAPLRRSASSCMLRNEGMAIPAMMPTITTTTAISISVMPLWYFDLTSTPRSARRQANRLVYGKDRKLRAIGSRAANCAKSFESGFDLLGSYKPIAPKCFASLRKAFQVRLCLRAKARRARCRGRYSGLRNRAAAACAVRPSRVAKSPTSSASRLADSASYSIKLLALMKSLHESGPKKRAVPPVGST
jgi:hypothetical protein